MSDPTLVQKPTSPETWDKARRLASRYQLVIWKEGDEWHGEGLELKGSIAGGATLEECVKETRESLAVLVTFLLDAGKTPPEPERDEAGLAEWEFATDYEDDEPKGDGADLIPAWFSDRMSTDDWSFGLLMSNGVVIHIDRIERFTRDASGDIWADVKLTSDGRASKPEDRFDRCLEMGMYCERAKASVNIKHVIAAYETEGH